MAQTVLDDEINPRKLEHIRIVLEESVEPLPSPFEKYRLPYRALPDIDLAEIDTKTNFLGYKLN
jgi:isopentenyl-diphosphate Delta-isomerase